MTRFTVFDPTRKFWQLFWIFRRSSRRRKSFQRLYPVEPLSPEPKFKDDRQATSLAESPMFAVDTAAGCVWDAVHHPNGDDSRREDEYCVLKAQNTLFKVRRCVLARDDSAFRGLESFPNGWKYANLRVIRISETAGKFRDLLWALHHVDPQNPSFVYNTSIFCLLNIAELSRKYHFPSFESWAADQLYKMLEVTALPFSLISTTPSSSASSSMTLTENMPGSPSMDSLCARLLDISFASRFDALFFLVARRIITQTLWHDYHSGETLVRTIQDLSVRRSRFKIQLHQLLGVVYYRMLVSLPCSSTSGGGLVFPRSMDVELRMCFLSAHESLTRMWAGIRSSLSPNRGTESILPSPHAGCKEMWDYYWAESARRAEQAACGRGTADVLDLLKSTMVAVRKIVADSPLVCLECSLAGLEAVDKVRDGIINNLSQLFVYC
ncbi:hypothetical protein ARMSODRAFT_514130 [Armillaria solidipes]|uniref:BTB domain-containing protein n=1 Tax=Armillaria solidipes TaxID=1076256 RepID=A0A2H3C7P9_9AGAR|nr:hypothetical protein ARMSODRAFT_514130 [Armillaria solidipes]